MLTIFAFLRSFEHFVFYSLGKPPAILPYTAPIDGRFPHTVTLHNRKKLFRNQSMSVKLTRIPENWRRFPNRIINISIAYPPRSIHSKPENPHNNPATKVSFFSGKPYMTDKQQEIFSVVSGIFS